MRHKISISIDEETILKVMDIMKSKKYRNKSHFFEIAAEKLMEDENA
jgi:hypothetical protein